MWTCDNCGEDENETNFRFCIACGVSRSIAPDAGPAGADVDRAFQTFVEDIPEAAAASISPPTFSNDEAIRQHRPAASLGERFKAAFSGRSSNSISIKVSPMAEEKLEELVRCGVFPEIAEAASYLLDEGIKSQTRLFEIVEQKISEIERLRAELRNLVNAKHL